MTVALMRPAAIAITLQITTPSGFDHLDSSKGQFLLQWLQLGENSHLMRSRLRFRLARIAMTSAPISATSARHLDRAVASDAAAEAPPLCMDECSRWNAVRFNVCPATAQPIARNEMPAGEDLAYNAVGQRHGDLFSDDASLGGACLRSRRRGDKRERQPAKPLFPSTRPARVRVRSLS